MPELITQTARLIPYSRRPRQMPSFVTAYAYEPVATQQAGSDIGSLYVVLEVLVAGRASEEVADLIIETAGDQYYNQPSADALPKERFDRAIKAVNAALAEHINRGSAAWIGKLSAVIAIHAAGELHLSSTGSAEAFLYRGHTSTHITQDGPPKTPTPTKSFGSIATGQLEAGDRLLLATPALVHQVQLTKLTELISESEPNTAIAELTQSLDHHSIDRIAALVIEVTTPQLAALRARSQAPSEIQLGTPENAVEAVKLAAAPIAETTVAEAKRAASFLRDAAEKTKPHARRAGLAAAAWIRRQLNTRPGRLRALIALVVIVVVGIALLARMANQNAATASFNQYQTVYQNFVKADQVLQAGNKSDAHELLIATQHQLNELTSQQNTINAKLKTATLPENEPRQFSAFQELIVDRLDQIDGLIKINPVTVVNFTTKNAQPKHFEINNSLAYLFDDNLHSLIILNLSTGTTKTSTANLSALGSVKSTTVSSSSDGIYILSADSKVWFYRFDTDSLIAQTIGLSQWPKASSIASYLSNLYLLGDGIVYKHLKNATGFSPKSDYITLDAASTKPSALAVDGSVYILTSKGLERYVAGVLKGTAAAPASLIGSSTLRSTAAGAALIATNSTTKRLGLWTATDTSLEFTNQIALSHISALYDATYLAKTNTAYALVDGRLVNFQLP